MDPRMNNNGYYCPPVHGLEGVPSAYQNPHTGWSPQILEHQIPQQQAPYHSAYNPNTEQTSARVPNIFHVPNPQQEPQPGFYLAQRILPESFPNLPNMPSTSLTPPIQPSLTPGPMMYSSSNQEETSSGPPFRYVNIEIPASEHTQPYIVSIPVPFSEFVPMSSYSGQQHSPIISSAQATSPQMVPSPFFCPPSDLQSPNISSAQATSAQMDPSPLLGPPSGLHSPWGHFIGGAGRGLGRRKKSKVGPTQISSEDSGSSRANPTEGETGFRYVIPCNLCQKNKEPRSFCHSHTLLDINGKVACPILRRYVCKVCGATGDNAHTYSHCPVRRQLKRGGGGEAVNQGGPGNGKGLEDVNFNLQNNS